VTTEDADALRLFDEQRDLLVGVAYRIVGQLSDADDVVQEAWLRWSSADRSDVRDPRAYLVRVTTRLAIDRLRRRAARREEYVGPWLPEPIASAPDAAEEVEIAENVSLGLLVVLETLSPLERAVFVLREAFGFSHAEIAGILGRNEAAVRQLARRARAHVDERRPRFTADRAARERVTQRFLAAAATGDLTGLIEVLAPGVTLVADGGGRAPAPQRAVEGAEAVARFLLAIASRPVPDLRVVLADVNGGPGVLVASGSEPIAAFALDVAAERVERVWIVSNPDKLVGVRGALAQN
jgi:RNA polymerase sigma-70 factor (ECF subfamily)